MHQGKSIQAQQSARRETIDDRTNQAYPTYDPKSGYLSYKLQRCFLNMPAFYLDVIHVYILVFG